MRLLPAEALKLPTLLGDSVSLPGFLGFVDS